MRRFRSIALFLVYVALVGLFNYELTAKSPRLVGQRLPGWQKARQADRATSWRQVTGVTALDKLLHEGAEALAFYDLAGEIQEQPGLTP